MTHWLNKQTELAEGKSKTPKWSLPHEPKMEHIVKMYDAADADTKTYGHNWYETAHHLAKKIGEGHENGTHKVAGVLSAYSPRTNWGRTIMHATRAMKNGAGHGGPGSGAPAAQGKQADRIIKGEHHSKVLGGEKTKAFAELIEHGGRHPEDSSRHSDRVVVDRHATSIAVGHRLSNNDVNGTGTGKWSHVWKNSASGKHHYNAVADAYRQAADHISKRDGVHVAPHQVQATTWEHYRKMTGTVDAEMGSGTHRSKDTLQTHRKPKVKIKEELIEDTGCPFSTGEYDETHDGTIAEPLVELEVEFTDRYGGKYPDMATVCRAGCDGVGYYPVYNGTPKPGDVRENRRYTDVELQKWEALHAAPNAHEADEGGKCDGWHFITCPSCGGSGKRSGLGESLLTLQQVRSVWMEHYNECGRCHNCDAYRQKMNESLISFEAVRLKDKDRDDDEDDAEKDVRVKFRQLSTPPKR